MRVAFRRSQWILVVTFALVCAACSAAANQAASTTPIQQSTEPTGSSGPLPRVSHIVVVVMENRSYGDVAGSSDTPYISWLGHHGALFTSSFAVAHPSQPNYLAMFSGSTQGIADDNCPYTFTAPNLALELLAAGKTFTGYAEDLPALGATVCQAGNYARKHVPWSDFSNVPSSLSQPFTSWPARDFTRLPTVAFVIPNLCDDMHDCPLATGDAWLRAHLGGYASWAMSHDSLLILTWDEDDGGAANHILTIIAGQPVRPGSYGEQITHYSILRTIEGIYGLPYAGAAAHAPPVPGIWRKGNGA